MSGNKDTKYVFRLQSESRGQHDLQNSLKHWDSSRMYDDKQINAIESSNERSFNQPTSIPSPFARIVLVKTAFGEVAEHGDKALAAYQKIVSDTLDVAEIFFTFGKWKNKVEIIEWNYGRIENNLDLDKDSSLKKLEKGHQQIYKTLKTFLENDAIEYNFDKMKSIYILKYKDTGKIIGATSPCTMFFSSANEFNKADEKGETKNPINITLSNNRKAFTSIVPLYSRNWDFQRYLYSWIAENNEIREVDGNAISVFKEFNKYLTTQKPSIKRTAEIDALNSIDNNLYNVLSSPNVEVLGKPIHQIKSITSANWYADDVLDDVLIRLPYKINRDSFFDGNLPVDSKETYLLPIKDRFFTQHSIQELKNFVKINHSGDVASVEIKLDTQNTPIKKNYKKSDNTLIELTFDCALFPKIIFANESMANYRFGLVCDFKEKRKFSAEFIKIDSTIDSSKKRTSVRNLTEINNRQLKNYTLESSSFDYIKINYGNYSGIIIPNFKQATGNKKFTFAVDFGTTNTHIEYKIDNDRNIKSFDITNSPVDDKQIHYLHGGEDLLRNYFDEEYISPHTDEEFRFPMRTALSYGEETNWLVAYPFEKVSLNELYEKRLDFPYNKTETNLKWSDTEHSRYQVKAYIESIMYILRNKVVLNNGSLNDTKIIWSYPVSMERTRYENLEKAWNEAYGKYFGGDLSNITPITESIAPFEYFIKDGEANRLVTIDIGGGTTDVVISTKGEADYISSFRLAANVVFGDGYSKNNRVKNGIVRQFFQQIKDELKTVIKNENDDIFSIFEEMCSSKGSDDIASFLFSIKHNKSVRDSGHNLAENINLSTKLINDTTQKITFIFFYTAIIYHVAKLMSALKTEMPDTIVFSGNGSRIIHFITSDETIIRDYTKQIFEKVYKDEYPSSNLKIILNSENPKEATCKGGLYTSKIYDFQSILNKKVVLHSNRSNEIIQNANPSKSDSYQFIDDDYIANTVIEAKEFIELVFENLSFFTERGYILNSNSIEIAKKTCFERLEIYTEVGWKLKRKEITDSELINESLFFYPLVGMFKDLTDAICDYNL